VFSSVSRAAARFEPQPGVGKFRAWLKAVAYSKIADHFRRQGKQPRAPGGTDAMLGMQAVADARSFQDTAAGESEPDESLAARHALQIVKDEFRDPTWQAFWRTAIDGRAAGDVAMELGVSAVAVRKAKSRVLSRLREFLDGAAEPEESP
jgi:RNA polymerase sigma-70 factor (ECF subfamily)